MNHLYESPDKKLHLCEGGQITNDRTTYVVWTKCGIDVLANESFKNYEDPTCEKCMVKEG